MTSQRHVLVVGNAPLGSGVEHYVSLVRGAETLIAADGGLTLCLAAGRAPDVCVGDFDSVEPRELSRARELGSQVRTFPRVKDSSDLDLAVETAREYGDRLTVTAAFSGRLDHTLASLGTLIRAADMQAVADEPEWKAYALDATHRAALTLEAKPGAVLSLMSVSGTATVSIDGVAYPLHRGALKPLSSLGLSNVASDERQEVVVHEGSVLLLVNARLTLS